MDIDVNMKGSESKVTIIGNIDTEGGAILSSKLEALRNNASIKNVIFDLKEVNSTTSAGIGKIMNFYKYIDSIGGKMEIKGISDPLYKQFVEIHLDRIFPVSK